MIHLYCFNQRKLIVISDLPSSVIKTKFGHQFEVLTSIKEYESLAVILPRIMRSYNQFKTLEIFNRRRKPHSDYTKSLISASMMGHSTSLETRMKISRTMAGKSNFEGKRHSMDTRDVMSDKARGNKRVAGLYWCHNPVTGVEKRVKDRNRLPDGFILGRNYDIIEAWMYRGPD